MNVASLLRKKALRRIALLAVLVAPIIYLFGTQIGALAGAHGEEVLAETEVLRDEETQNAQNNESINFDNNRFGVTKIYGKSTIDGDIVKPAVIDGFSYQSTLRSALVEFPEISLHGFNTVFDDVTSDGIYTQRIISRDIGSMSWNKSNVFYIPTTSLNSYRAGNAYIYSSYPIADSTQDSFNFSNSYLTFNYQPNSPFASMTAEQFRVAMTGKNLLFSYKVPIVTEIEPLNTIGLIASSPVTIDFGTSLDFDFVSWGGIYQTTASNRDSLFDNMFGTSNFLTDWGQNALDDTAGLPPVNQLLKFIAEDGLNISESNIGLMGIGYATYLIHAIMIYEFIVLAIELLTIPLKIGDWFTKGVNNE